MIKFVLNGLVFQIDNNVIALSERMEELATSFTKCADGVSYHFKMTINQDNVVIFNGIRDNKLNICPNVRDSYQLFYLFISYCLNSNQRVLIHSVMVSRNGKGFLILGTFGSGKTTLSFEMEKLGFEINSADHSLIEIENNKLFFVGGTRRIKYNNITTYIGSTHTDKKIEIMGLYYLIGMSDGGSSKISVEEDNIRIAKKLWSSITWLYTNPLQKFTNELLMCINQNIYDFVNNVSKLNIKMNICRGDSKIIANNILNTTKF